MFEDKTYDSILSDMLSQVDSSLDKREGSIIYDALAPCAFRLAEVYLALEDMAKNLYADTAQEKYLEEYGASLGVERKQANSAILRMQVVPSTLVVALGTVFRLNEALYSVSGAFGGGVYEITAQRAGSGYAPQSGSLVPISYLAGFESASVSSVTFGGSDLEDLEHYRARVQKSLEPVSFGGSMTDYVTWAKKIAGVGHVRVTPTWECGSGVVVEITGDNYSQPSDELIAQVQEALCPTGHDAEGIGVAPIGHSVTVQSGSWEPLNLILNLTVKSGYTRAGLQDAIYAALKNKVAEMRVLWDEGETVVLHRSVLMATVETVRGIEKVNSIYINEEGGDIITDKIPNIVGVSYVNC